MDSKRFKKAWTHLESLDDRLTHRIRYKNETSRMAPSNEALDERLRDLARYSLELKEITRELFLSLARKKEE